MQEPILSKIFNTEEAPIIRPPIGHCSLVKVTSATRPDTSFDNIEEIACFSLKGLTAEDLIRRLTYAISDDLADIHDEYDNDAVRIHEKLLTRATNDEDWEFFDEDELQAIDVGKIDVPIDSVYMRGNLFLETQYVLVMNNTQNYALLDAAGLPEIGADQVEIAVRKSVSQHLDFHVQAAARYYGQARSKGLGF